MGVEDSRNSRESTRQRGASTSSADHGSALDASPRVKSRVGGPSGIRRPHDVDLVLEALAEHQAGHSARPRGRRARPREGEAGSRRLSVRRPPTAGVPGRPWRSASANVPRRYLAMAESAAAGSAGRATAAPKSSANTRSRTDAVPARRPAAPPRPPRCASGARFPERAPARAATAQRRCPCYQGRRAAAICVATITTTAETVSTRRRCTDGTAAGWRTSRQRAVEARRARRRRGPARRAAPARCRR